MAAVLALNAATHNPSLLRELVDSKGVVDIRAADAGAGPDPATPTEEHALALYVHALDALAARREGEDIDRIRAAFADTRVDLPESTYAYLGAVGDWSDAYRIVLATQERRGTPPPTLLSISDRRGEYGWAAEALIALGNGAWAKLLALEPASAVLRQLVLETPQKAWRTVGNSLLLRLFANADESVREAAALRCVRDLPIKRIRAVLDHFQAKAESRFYSVSHWLDFGMAAPRAIAVPAARRKLDALRQPIGLGWQ